MICTTENLVLTLSHIWVLSNTSAAYNLWQKGDNFSFYNNISIIVLSFIKYFFIKGFQCRLLQICCIPERVKCIGPIAWCHFQQFFQLFHSISLVSYHQYYWSIFPNTSQSDVMLTLRPWASRRAAITTIFKVFKCIGSKPFIFENIFRLISISN